MCVCVLHTGTCKDFSPCRLQCDLIIDVREKDHIVNGILVLFPFISISNLELQERVCTADFTF